ncbi:MAG: putative spermidine/putrescine transport system permease protein [Thermoleophilaceae bacterium]|jgi:putative spermidine/putrescine transport system permease protein|nr:putative spermidine/putrescine transport system permease protein [Thermoleophilaceae bacterium]
MTVSPQDGGGRPSGGARLRGLGGRAWIPLVLPALLILAVFFFYPLAEIVRRSFAEIAPPGTSPFGNYQWFFDTPANLTILRRTIVTAVAVTAACLLVAYPYAYLMTVVGRRTRAVLLALVLVPFWTSLMVRNFAWIVLLQDQGPVNDALAAVGVGRQRLIGNVSGVTIAMIQILLPFATLPIYAVLRGIDRRLLQAAQSLGAPPWRAFLKVYLPLSAPGILAGALIVFVISLGFYVTPALLGSPTNALISQFIFIQVSTLLDWGRGGAMAVVLLVVAMVLIGLGSLAARRGQSRLSTGIDPA